MYMVGLSSGGEVHIKTIGYIRRVLASHIDTHWICISIGDGIAYRIHIGYSVGTRIAHRVHLYRIVE